MKTRQIRLQFKLQRTEEFAGTDDKKMWFTVVPRAGVPGHERISNDGEFGILEVMVRTPEAREFFVLGRDYYFDITAVPAKDCTPESLKDAQITKRYG